MRGADVVGTGPGGGAGIAPLGGNGGANGANIGGALGAGGNVSDAGFVDAIGASDGTLDDATGVPAVTIGPEPATARVGPGVGARPGDTTGEALAEGAPIRIAPGSSSGQRGGGTFDAVLTPAVDFAGADEDAGGMGESGARDCVL